MKDFVKKVISAVMAMALTASMSVYAEEVVPVENAMERKCNESVLDVVNREAEILALPPDMCLHPNDKLEIIELIETTSYRHTHSNGKRCTVIEDRFRKTYICQTCLRQRYEYQTVVTHTNGA